MDVVIRPWPRSFHGRATLTVCINYRQEAFVASCGRRGALAIREALEQELRAQRVPVTLAAIACLGLCEKGPNARLAPANSWFHDIRIDDLAELVSVVRSEVDRLNSSAGENDGHCSAAR
jgi:NADH:ubiquinone oxidoreductase subunit E